MNNFYPMHIDATNFKYIKVNDSYIITLNIVKYPKELCFTEFIKLIPKNMEYTISMFFSKQDVMKILKGLTYNISLVKSEIKTSSSNQIDTDVLDKLNSDAKKLRYEIQINNEEIYNVHIFFTLKSKDEKELMFAVNKFRSMLYSKMLVTQVLNFRQLEGYLSSLPLNNLNLNKQHTTMTTSNIANLFPFFTNTILDKNSTLFGYIKESNNICSINTFSSRYTNSNMCIFGTSGSGKSYFTKLYVLRQQVLDVCEYIFDPEGEYLNVAKALNGRIIGKDNSFNVLQLNECDILDKNYLDKKVDQVYELLDDILELSLYKSQVMDAIYKAYLDKGITKDILTIYETSGEGIVYIEKRIKELDKMPILSDVYNNMKSNKEIKDKKILTKFKKFIEDHEYLNSVSNTNFNNELVIFDFSKVNSNYTYILYKYYMKLVIKEIKFKNKKSLIFVDEVWKYMKSDKDTEYAIFSLFKTIRKLNAGIVVITQDISDFFNTELYEHGKSILNNSCIKMFFKMQYSDTSVLKKLGILDEDKIIQISKLTKGSALMNFENNLITIDIKANEYEDKIIKGEIK